MANWRRDLDANGQLIASTKGVPTAKMCAIDISRTERRDPLPSEERSHATGAKLNRERLIIILYYYEELTMKEIGATLDLSESRVSQMHSSIVQRLQNQLARRRPEFGG